MRRGLRTAVLVGAVTLVLSACQGFWTTTSHPSPVRAVHAALLRTGKVLLIAGSGNDPAEFAAGTFKTAIYDPTTGTLRSDIATPYDMFCSGHAFLPDGRLLVAGGTTAYAQQRDRAAVQGREARPHLRPGHRDVPDRAVDGDRPLVPDGGVARRRLGSSPLAGFDDKGNHSNTFQTYNPTTAHVVGQPADRHVAEWRRRLLTALPVDAPDGRRPPLLLRRARASRRGRTPRRTAGTSTRTDHAGWTATRRSTSNDRDQAASVLLPPAQAQKVMVIGGGHEANTNVARRVDGGHRPHPGEPDLHRGPADSTPRRCT